jgi:hypothetical protein
MDTAAGQPILTLSAPPISSPVLLAPVSWSVPAWQQSDPMVPQIVVPVHGADRSPAALFDPLDIWSGPSRFGLLAGPGSTTNSPPRSLRSLSRITRRIGPARTPFRHPQTSVPVPPSSRLAPVPIDLAPSPRPLEDGPHPRLPRRPTVIPQMPDNAYSRAHVAK